MAISKVRPMTFYVARAAAPASFTALIAGTFGGLGLLLAAIGVYSVVSYSISQRTQELGVRMALGARPADIVRLVIREGLILAAGGIVLGTECALVLSRYLQSLLSGVTAVGRSHHLQRRRTDTRGDFSARLLAACMQGIERIGAGCVAAGVTHAGLPPRARR